MHMHPLVCFCAAACVVVGCSTHEERSSSIGSDWPDSAHLVHQTLPHFITAPTNFIRLISPANRVVVRSRSQEPAIKDISFTLAGEESKQVINAISLLKDDRVIGVSSVGCGCEDKKLEFYDGTNLLGTADFGQDFVYLDREYQDYTGTLKRIDAEWWDKVDRQ